MPGCRFHLLQSCSSWHEGGNLDAWSKIIASYFLLHFYLKNFIKLFHEKNQMSLTKLVLALKYKSLVSFKNNNLILQINKYCTVSLSPTHPNFLHKFIQNGGCVFTDQRKQLMEVRSSRELTMQRKKYYYCIS